MAQRYLFDPAKEGVWGIKKEGAKRAIQHFDMEEDGLGFSRP